jgi:SMC interacting uncharacterized protein involved in chromosome segregation
MFNWFKNKQVKILEEKTENSFSAVKGDMDKIGRWIKHLDQKDKQLFDLIFELKEEISSIKEEVESLREGVDIVSDSVKDKQVFKKLPVLDKQTAVQAVQIGVQTAVQTSNIYDILKSLSSNEKMIVYALLNNDMKLSYEDLALLLGKERATIRGQINAIKQKNESLIEEVVEKNGKKRVFVRPEIREKLQKYAKVRVKSEKKSKKDEEISKIQ